MEQIPDTKVIRSSVLRCRNFNGMQGMCPLNAIDCHGAQGEYCYWHRDETGWW